MPWLPAHYSLIEKLSKSQIVGPRPEINGKGFWFAYFWEECGEADFLAPVKDAVARLFNQLFVLPPQWDPTDLRLWIYDQFPGGHLEEIRRQGRCS